MRGADTTAGTAALAGAIEPTVFMRTPFLYGATLRAAASLLLAGMTIAARRELAHHVGARLGRQSDACRGSATSGGQRSLCEGACGGISGDAPRGGRAFAGLRVARDHGAGQGMRQSRRDAVLGGAVVVQIFMQPRRYSVLHGGLHRVGRKPGAQAFAETGGAAAILPWRLPSLRHPSAD